MIIYAALVAYGISLLTLGDDEAIAQSRTLRQVLRIAGLVALAGAALVAFRSPRLGVLIMAVCGFGVLMAVAAECRRRQGGCTVKVPGVYLGEAMLAGVNVQDVHGNLQPLHTPYFQYEFDDDMYCTASQDRLFGSTLDADFREGRFYWLYVDPSEPWRCRYVGNARGTGQAAAMAFALLGVCAIIETWMTAMAVA